MMNLALWIVAGLLAALFLLAGSTKLFIPREGLAEAPGGGWTLDFGAGFVKFLGAAEVLGAVGLIVPALLGIAPVLVPLAALGLGLIMVGAAQASPLSPGRAAGHSLTAQTRPRPPLRVPDARSARRGLLRCPGEDPP